MSTCNWLHAYITSKHYDINWLCPKISLITGEVSQPLLAPLTILPIFISSKGYERQPFTFRHANG